LPKASWRGEPKEGRTVVDNLFTCIISMAFW
jgi:hypothetical protein